MTERLIWTIGAAGTLRSFTRSGCDWVATTYRCLLLVPEALQLRYTREEKCITNDTRQTLISWYSFSMVTFSTFKCFRQINC